MINYYLVTKPGIILGNLVTVTAGFLLASKGAVDPWLFLSTLGGLGFIIASACVFNNFIDRQLDRKMERTKDRVLAKGLISESNAIFFAVGLGIAGGLLLLLRTNLLTLFVASIGFFVYVVLYSLWKGRTIYGTAIGSIAGAVPPVVGYCAVSNHFDAGALILFLMLVLWQMPHFFAIALFHLEDYTAAGIPVLPIQKGVFRTKIHMLLYIFSFSTMAMMLTFFNYTGYLFLIVASSCGLTWLWLCARGFNTEDDSLWGRRMFRLSLVLIAAICLAIPLDTV
jgi:protoheme IX farnesyltransferase